MVPYTDISNGFNILTFLSSANRKTSILWDVVGAHLSLQLCPNGSEAADDPRVERDAIHWIKPNSVSRDQGHYTFSSIISFAPKRSASSSFFGDAAKTTVSLAALFATPFN